MTNTKSRRARLVGAAACLATFTLAALPARAVVCPPGEPDFAYRDVGNDGCFNMGIDTEIPEATLLAASYDSTPDGIVVPPTVKLAPAGNISWTSGSLWIRGDIEGAGDAAFSSPSCEVEGTSQISTVSISFNSSGAVIVGDGAKLTASTGGLVISVGSGITVGAGARLTGGLVSLSGNGGITIGEGSDVESTDTSVSLSNSNDIDLQAGVAVVSNTSLSVSNGGFRTLGDGVSLTGVSTVSVGGSANTMIGNNVKISGSSVSFGSGGALQCADKLSVESSQNEISVSAGFGVTLGAKTKLQSASFLSVGGGGGGIFLGTGSKLTAGQYLSMSCFSDLSIGEKSKLAAEENLSLSNGGNQTIGAKSKLSAGLDVHLTPNNSGAALVLNDSVKVTSGTQKAPMQTSLIELDSGSIQLADKVSLKGSDKLNTISILPADSLVTGGAKLAGQTIAIGDALDAPFVPFQFLDTQVKGSADAATFTINAPMTTCDLTGSKFSKLVTDFTSCATVVGP